MMRGSEGSGGASSREHLGPGTGIKKSKPAMEKRRRARINASLAELRSLIPESVKKHNRRYSKMEKADILELAVQYLRHLQEASKDKRQVSTTSYSLGFSECTQEVSEFFRSNSPFTARLKGSLLEHLNGCAPYKAPDSPSSSPTKTGSSIRRPIEGAFRPSSIIAQCLLSTTSIATVRDRNVSTPAAVSSTSDDSAGEGTQYGQDGAARDDIVDSRLQRSGGDANRKSYVQRSEVMSARRDLTSSFNDEQYICRDGGLNTNDNVGNIRDSTSFSCAENGSRAMDIGERVINNGTETLTQKNHSSAVLNNFTCSSAGINPGNNDSKDVNANTLNSGNTVRPDLGKLSVAIINKDIEQSHGLQSAFLNSAPTVQMHTATSTTNQQTVTNAFADRCPESPENKNFPKYDQHVFDTNNNNEDSVSEMAHVDQSSIITSDLDISPSQFTTSSNHNMKTDKPAFSEFPGRPGGITDQTYSHSEGEGTPVNGDSLATEHSQVPDSLDVTLPSDNKATFTSLGTSLNSRNISSFLIPIYVQTSFGEGEIPSFQQAFIINNTPTNVGVTGVPASVTPKALTPQMLTPKALTPIAPKIEIAALVKAQSDNLTSNSNCQTGSNLESEERSRTNAQAILISPKVTVPTSQCQNNVLPEKPSVPQNSVYRKDGLSVEMARGDTNIEISNLISPSQSLNTSMQGIATGSFITAGEGHSDLAKEQSEAQCLKGPVQTLPASVLSTTLTEEKNSDSRSGGFDSTTNQSTNYQILFSGCSKRKIQDWNSAISVLTEQSRVTTMQEPFTTKFRLIAPKPDNSNGSKDSREDTGSSKLPIKQGISDDSFQYKDHNFIRKSCFTVTGEKIPAPYTCRQHVVATSGKLDPSLEDILTSNLKSHGPLDRTCLVARRRCATFSNPSDVACPESHESIHSVGDSSKSLSDLYINKVSQQTCSEEHRQWQTCEVPESSSDTKISDRFKTFMDIKTVEDSDHQCCNLRSTSSGRNVLSVFEHGSLPKIDDVFSKSESQVSTNVNAPIMRTSGITPESKTSVSESQNNIWGFRAKADKSPVLQSPRLLFDFSKLDHNRDIVSSMKSRDPNNATTAPNKVPSGKVLAPFILWPKAEAQGRNFGHQSVNMKLDKCGDTLQKRLDSFSPQPLNLSKQSETWRMPTAETDFGDEEDSEKYFSNTTLIPESGVLGNQSGLEYTRAYKQGGKSTGLVVHKRFLRPFRSTTFEMSTNDTQTHDVDTPLSSENSHPSITKPSGAHCKCNIGHQSTQSPFQSPFYFKNSVCVNKVKQNKLTSGQISTDDKNNSWVPIQESHRWHDHITQEKARPAQPGILVPVSEESGPGFRARSWSVSSGLSSLTLGAPNFSSSVVVDEDVWRPW